MKTFLGIMSLIMISTMIAWHSYTNPNLTEYEEVRSVFILAIFSEFFLIVFVLVITAIKNRKP